MKGYSVLLCPLLAGAARGRARIDIGVTSSMVTLLIVQVLVKPTEVVAERLFGEIGAK